MPANDRKFVYTVEIDLQTAAQAAEQMRALFAKALAQVEAMPTLHLPQPPQQQLADVQKQAKAASHELDAIAKQELSKPTAKLRQEVKQLQQDAQAAENALQNMYFVGGRPGSQHSARFSAQLQEYYGKVEHELGREAANIARASGRVGSIGDINAQFVNDTRPIEEYETSVFREVEEKRRFTLEEQQRMAELEAEVYARKLAANRVEQEILQRELAEIEQATAGIELNEQTAEYYEVIDQEYQRNRQETEHLLEAEQDLAQSLASAKRRLAEVMEKESAKAEKTLEEKLVGGPAVTTMPAVATPMGPSTGRLTAISVTEKSAANAQRLAESLHEAAAATERMQQAEQSRSTSTGGERQRDLEMLRQKAEIERRNAQMIVQITELERTEGTQRRAEIQKTLSADRVANQQRLIAARQTATQATQATRSQASMATQTARAEASARIAASRAEAQAQIEAARAARATITEQERRKTAEFKAELRERQRATRTSQGRSVAGSAGSFPLGGMGFGIAGGALGALGMVGIEQTVRTLYREGQTGARQERQQLTFESLAERAGVSADKMVQAIRQASRETVDEMTAIGYGAQILAQRFASSSDDIVEDTADLMRASRRLAQIFTDEQGQFLTTQEVFARLVKFIREGNKELVDQFAISNSRIADKLGISKEGLASAEGAALRFQGVLAILRDEMERLGDTSDTTADRMEQAEARLTTSRNRIRSALAVPASHAAAVTANIVEAVVPGPAPTYDEARAGLENRMAQMRYDLERGACGGAGAAIQGYGGEQQMRSAVAMMETVTAVMQRATAATESGQQGAKKYVDTLRELALAITEQGSINEEQLDLLAQVARYYDLLADGGIVLADSQGMVAEQSDGAKQKLAELATEARAAAGEFGFLADMVWSAGADLESLEGKVGDLQGRLAHVRAEAAPRQQAAQGIGRAVISGGQRLVEAGIADRTTADAMIHQALGELEAREEAWRRRGPSGVDLALDEAEAREQILAPFAEAEQAARQAEQAQQQALRQWEGAAKKTAQEFEKAAKESQKAFEDALGKVPGLFGTSDVTEEDMKLAKAGVYQPKADEYLRQLRDEVLNKVDHVGVDIADAAARAGLRGDLAPEVQLTLFEQKWASGTLFADQRNLELLNRNAVLQNLADQRLVREGQQNLTAYFGMDTELANISGLGGPQDGSEWYGAGVDLGAPLAQGVADGMTERAAETIPAFMLDLKGTMEAQLADGATTTDLLAIGGNVAGLIYDGFAGALGGQAWLGAIVSTVSAQVMEQIADTVAQQ